MKKLMLGNEAVARGAYEAGVRVVSSYPGTPSTEITEFCAAYPEIDCEWAPNEKVAVETAFGAAMTGARAMSCMKHVGVNVAADPLYTAAYTGVNAGMVIVAADDPYMHSSQNEQDSRMIARAAHIPMLEPADSQECKDFTKRAFELSEQFDTPFMLRTTVRVNHGSSIVTLEDRVEVPVKHYERDIMKNTNIPALARNKHKTVEERLVRLQEFSNETDLNRVELHDTKIGVICAGICYQYAREVFGDGASYLKLGFTYPMPDRKIREFAAQVDKLYVLEELDPFIEDYVRGLGIECTGKAVLPLYLEYSADIIRRALGLPGVSAAYEAPVQAPVRPASFCAGCPHRGIYHEISKYNGKIVATGDIGCYALNINPPFSVTHTQINMGGSITAGHGFERVERFAQRGLKVFSFIGDSTFFHSGITGLINAVYNGAKTSIFILDNSTTGMTGHQDNPVTGVTLMKDVTTAVDIKTLVLGCGVKPENVRTVDSYDLKATAAVVKEAYEAEDLFVVIVRQPCALLKSVIAHRKGQHCRVNADKCRSCKVCINKTACPALTVGENGVSISTEDCNGCTICQQICPFGAIEKEGE